MPATEIARRRLLIERSASIAIGAAGFAVIGLLLLMLWYLLRTALPLAEPFRIELLGSAPLPAGAARSPAVLVRRTTDAKIIASVAPDGVTWSLRGDGRYRCQYEQAWRALSGLRGEPRIMAFGEIGATLLVMDAGGLLYRYAAQRGSGCALIPLGEPRQQPFVARELIAETNRPVLYLFSDTQRLRVLHSVSGALLFDGPLPAAEGATGFRLNAVGSLLTAGRGAQVLQWRVSNRFPESGWRSLWRAQHYSGYATEAQVWHPDGESVGALSKYGLTPLLFGTFKAALYGMLVAVPLALGAAIYTGYFLSRRERNRIKPAVELLEAFPTVVLGFLAGLWLAPRLGDQLLLVFVTPLALVLIPLLLALSHLLLQRLSPAFMFRPARGRLVLIVYLLVLPLLLVLAPPLEQALFEGSLRDWLLRVAGLRYEQRNALVVGFAMGLALLPTLFSIVEDAVFAVPRDLSDGSLALGATRWQSLSRVVLPAASPAILSALLIGLARGLGETMIVLLATGNTPLVEASAFTGLRALGASLAAELPDAAVGSTHFRVLFLAALVLFALTFVLNTIAELFRQRLRYRYAGR